MDSRKAFTLIELLVAVAIIALLIALLIPNLARARDYAKMTKCGANLHAIGIGLATYAGNNKGFCIDAFDTQRDFGNGPVDSNWTDRLVLDGDVAMSLRDASGTALAGSATPAFGLGIFICPSADKSVQFDLPGSLDPNNGATGYGIPRWPSSHWEYVQNGVVYVNGAPNSNPGGYLDNHALQGKYVAQLLPSHIYVVEGNSIIQNQVGGTWGYWVYLRHFNKLLNATLNSGQPPTYSSGELTYSGRANYLMCDFHVEVNSWKGAPTDLQSYYDKYPSTYGSGAKQEHSVWWQPDN